ncbi:hypothetical protein M2354_003986 [Leclercia adecarboxylata]|nr:hypothetical protein [Leclercia adecarboxylata]
MTVRILAVCGNGNIPTYTHSYIFHFHYSPITILIPISPQKPPLPHLIPPLIPISLIISTPPIHPFVLHTPNPLPPNRGEISVTGNKYVVGVRNMLSPADFGPKLLEVIKEHFPQDVK